MVPSLQSYQYENATMGSGWSLTTMCTACCEPTRRAAVRQTSTHVRSIGHTTRTRRSRGVQTTAAPTTRVRIPSATSTCIFVGLGSGTRGTFLGVRLTIATGTVS